MSVNYSILANNPVWNPKTVVSNATTVPKFVPAVGVNPSSGGVMIVTVVISNVGTVNLFLADSTKVPIATDTELGSNGIMLQPGSAITVGVSGADLVLLNPHEVTDGSFVSVSYA